MSSLRGLGNWKRPEPYLALLLVSTVLAIGDSLRQPKDQILARAYVQAVLEYQRYGRPISAKFIRCRYRPTCSQYSLEAVERFGIGRGLALTLRRVVSCRGNVAFGTPDPVPAS
ncbi:MAG TPA: membrane protein insertion efficiency factor YidD [Bryobacteraceae bacterium]|jgi:hypothetical protein|nr:membrane protein insertion efficiency factor YidD [Bryobacteraceae bacterium]